VGQLAVRMQDLALPVEKGQVILIRAL